MRADLVAEAGRIKNMSGSEGSIGDSKRALGEFIAKMMRYVQAVDKVNSVTLEVCKKNEVIASSSRESWDVERGCLDAARGWNHS